MDAETLAKLISTGVGIALSLLFSYVPSLSKWFYELRDDYRGLIMVGLNVLAVGALYVLSCVAWIEGGFCTDAGVKDLITALGLALIANQTTYMVTPESPTRKQLREAQDSPLTES